MFLFIAKEIWDAVSQTYSKIRIHATKQGSRRVTESYYKARSLWLELDHYQHIEMVVVEDTTILKKIMEQERVFEFLTSLYLELDQI